MKRTDLVAGGGKDTAPSEHQHLGGVKGEVDLTTSARIRQNPTPCLLVPPVIEGGAEGSAGAVSISEAGQCHTGTVTLP